MKVIDAEIGDEIKTPIGTFEVVEEEGKLGVVFDYDLTFVTLDDLSEQCEVVSKDRKENKDENKTDSE